MEYLKIDKSEIKWNDREKEANRKEIFEWMIQSINMILSIMLDDDLIYINLFPFDR